MSTTGSTTHVQRRQPTRTVGQSKLDRWTKGPGAARTRLQMGVTIPEWSPSFQIPADAQVFALGSCFARNLEAALRKIWQEWCREERQSSIPEMNG